MIMKALLEINISSMELNNNPQGSVASRCAYNVNIMFWLENTNMFSHQ